jgi:hypothetical protein
VTIANTEPATPAVYKEAVVDPFSGEVVDFEGVEDAAVVDFLAAATAKKRQIVDAFLEMENATKYILEQRMRARGATAIPHPQYEIALVEEFAPYAYDLEALTAAKVNLPDDEAQKLCKFVPEYQPPPVPAHYEPGLPVSIKAICKRYGWDLNRFMRRDSLGVRFKFKPRVSAPKPVEQIEEK